MRCRCVLLVVGIVFVFMCLVYMLIPAGINGVYADETRDIEPVGDIIVINETLTISDVSYKIDGNITVNNGTLFINNSYIEFSQDVLHPYQITVTNGSIFFNSVTLSVYLNLHGPNAPFSIIIDHSTFYMYDSVLDYFGSFVTINSNVYFYDSIITCTDGNYAPILNFYNSSIEMYRSRVENYYRGDDIAVDVNIPEEGFTIPSQSSRTIVISPIWSAYIPTTRLSAATIKITFTGEKNYTTKDILNISVDGINYYECKSVNEFGNECSDYTIKFNNTTESKKYDLYQIGVDNLNQIQNIYLRINNTETNTEKSNITITGISLKVSIENDITLINSSLLLMDSYLDVDFQKALYDPYVYADLLYNKDFETLQKYPYYSRRYLTDANIEHAVLRVLDNSMVNLYNITITGGDIQVGYPAFIADSYSKVYIYRYTHITTRDFSQTALGNVDIEVIYNNETVTFNDSRIGRYLSQDKFNVTDNAGNIILPLCSDLIDATTWPNSDGFGYYQIIARYKNFTEQLEVNLSIYPHLEYTDNNVWYDIIFSELYSEFRVKANIQKSAMENDNVTISITIWNDGTLDARNVTVDVYIDENKFTGSVVNIPASEFVNISYNWSAESGIHKFDIIVDSENAIPEKNENNNNYTCEIYVFTLPDISISSDDITLDVSKPVEGDNLMVYALIHNLGEINATCNISFFYYISGKRYEIGYVENIFVLGLDTVNISLPNTWNTTGISGDIVIQVLIDTVLPHDNVPENNYANITVHIRTKPDLYISEDDVTFSEPLTTGSVTSVGVWLHNSGETDAVDVFVVFYDNDEKIDTKIVSVGAENKEYITVLWNPLYAGIHTIRIYVDEQNLISESNESNNNISIGIYVKTRANLFLTEIYLSTYTVGDTIVYAVVNNTGESYGETTVYFYEENTLIGSSDVSVSGMSSGTCSIKYSFDDVGTHTIRAELTYEENFSELRKNIKIKTRPDIEITDITLSNMNPIAGTVVDIIVMLQNHGETTATCNVELYWSADGVIRWIDTLENVTVYAGSAIEVRVYGFDTTEKNRTVSLIGKVVDCIPEESETANNEFSREISIYLPDFDKIIYTETNITDYNWIRTGHIVINNTILRLVNTTLNILQENTGQYHIVILGNGELIVENSVITSIYPVDVYLYDNSSLILHNSTINGNVIADTKDILIIRNAILNGSMNVKCDEIIIDNTEIVNDVNLNCNKAYITKSRVNYAETFDVSILYVINTTFESAISINGLAHFINVTVPEVQSVNDGIILIYWYVGVRVIDKNELPVNNTNITIISVDDNTVFLSGVTDENGRMVVSLPAWNISHAGKKYVGAYDIVAEKNNNTTAKTITVQTENMNVNLKFSVSFIVPSQIFVNVNVIPTVTVEKKINITGIVSYDNPIIDCTGIPVKVTVNGETYTTYTDTNGVFSVPIDVPKKTGRYSVEVSASDTTFNLQDKEISTLIVRHIVKPNYTILTIVIVIVIISCIVVLYITREDLVIATLKFIKSKIKRESFIDCSQCGKETPKSESKCIWCGYSFEEQKELVKCSECGALIPADAVRCPSCGAVFEE